MRGVMSRHKVELLSRLHKTELCLCIMLCGVGWCVLMEWLRHRSWVKHRDSGFSPGTQHLAMLAAAGMALAIIVTAVVFFFVPIG